MQEPTEATGPAISSQQIRPDLLAGHSHAWEKISAPGTWWTGVQRVALARAARYAWECELCSERKSSLSPTATPKSGRTDHDGLDACNELPVEIVEVVHRLVRDQSRLSREWLDDLVGRRVLSKAKYVELVGVVARAVSIDVFYFALGFEPEPLPTPLPGEPTAYTPPGLAMEKAWVPMILTENLGPNEKDLYGPTGNVIRALSSVPEEVRELRKLSAVQYIAVEKMRDFVGGESLDRSIDRAQTELVAARVSALHECFY